MRWLALLVALLLSTTVATADDRPTFQSLWEHASSAPGREITDGGLATVVSVPGEYAIYYFSKPGEDIHPGVIKRDIVKQGDTLYIHTVGWSFAPDEAQGPFTRWLEAFKAQDAQIMNQAEQRKRKR